MNEYLNSKEVRPIYAIFGTREKFATNLKHESLCELIKARLHVRVEVMCAHVLCAVGCYVQCNALRCRVEEVEMADCRCYSTLPIQLILAHKNHKE